MEKLVTNKDVRQCEIRS